MIAIPMTSSDLAAIRFAYSPLMELVISYKVLRKPCVQQPYQQWVDEAHEALRGVELPYMDAVILPGYIVDFLTPPPLTTERDIEAEFERVRNTPEDLIRQNVLTAIQFSEELTSIRQFFLDFPCESVECLIEELRLYWRRTLAHHWNAMQSVLENDVLYRARQYATQGIEVLFPDLSNRLQFADGQLKLDQPVPCVYGTDLQLGGRGLQLVPALFAHPMALMWQIAPEWQPMLVYSARGAGLWYQQQAPEPDIALEIALGVGRARLLQTLINPANTTELARHLHLTPGAVSQHLGKLHQAGLVESHRSGNRVFYRLSPRGERLLDVFS